MATTTKITGTASANNYGFYANVIVGDLNTLTQKFPVTVDVYLVNHGVRTDSNYWTKSITCDGTTTSASNQNVKTNDVSSNGGEKKVYTASFNVNIKSTITVSAYLSKSSYSQYDPAYCSLSGTISMPKAASTWNSSLLAIADVESSFTLPINKYVSTYTNTVTITNLNMSTVVKTINDANDGDSVTFTSSELETLYTIDNNANKEPITFYMNLYTYDSNNNQVGEAQRLTCDAGLSNAKPSLSSAGVTETNANVISLAGGATASKVTEYVSMLKVQVKVTPKYGASITNVTVNEQAATYNSSTQKYETVLTNILRNSGTFLNPKYAYSIKATDSRGLQTTTSISNSNVQRYIVLTINTWSIKRAGQTSDNVILNADISCWSSTLYNQSNTPTVQYSTDNSTWTTIPSTDYTFSSNKITITNLTLQNVISHQVNGTFYLKVSDLLMTATDNKEVPVGIYTFAKSDRKIRINGTLEIADADTNNRFEIRNPITYSSSETFTGYWTDGKPVYRKVIDFGALPSATSKDVAHGISNLKEIVKIDGITTYTINNVKGWRPLPLLYAGTLSTYNTEISVDETNITIKSDMDRSSYTAKVYLEYTKTTD